MTSLRVRRASLRPGPRSAGRSRDQIIRHVYINEPEQFSRKVEVRTPPPEVMTPDGLARHRQAYLEDHPKLVGHAQKATRCAAAARDRAERPDR
jgi:hypothetical protein